MVSAEALTRLERNVAREQAARYLSDAGDVLVTMAATPAECDRKDERIDVGQASARSRELLARRALLLESGPQAVASAPCVWACSMKVRVVQVREFRPRFSVGIDRTPLGWDARIRER